MSPLKGSKWFTVAGGKDQNPDRDGIPGMRASAQWLRKQGAEVIREIEDPNAGHGAFHLNMSNSKVVLDYLLSLKVSERR